MRQGPLSLTVQLSAAQMPLAEHHFADMADQRFAGARQAIDMAYLQAGIFGAVAIPGMHCRQHHLPPFLHTLLFPLLTGYCVCVCVHTLP